MIIKTMFATRIKLIMTLSDNRSTNKCVSADRKRATNKLKRSIEDIDFSIEVLKY